MLCRRPCTSSSLRSSSGSGPDAPADSIRRGPARFAGRRGCGAACARSGSGWSSEASPRPRLGDRAGGGNRRRDLRNPLCLLHRDLAHLPVARGRATAWGGGAGPARARRSAMADSLGRRALPARLAHSGQPRGGGLGRAALRSVLRQPRRPAGSRHPVAVAEAGDHRDGLRRRVADRVGPAAGAQRRAHRCQAAGCRSCRANSSAR